MTRAATPAIAGVVAAGVAHEVLTYHHDARAKSGWDIELDPHDLSRLTGAVVADIRAL